MKLEPGLYELLINNEVEKSIKLFSDQFEIDISKIDPGDSHDFISQHFSKLLSKVLSEFKGEDKVLKQIKLYNELIQVIQKHNPDYNSSDLCLGDNASSLKLIRNKLSQKFQIPETSLSIGSLLTANSGDPSLLSQLKQELLNADSVDILVSFIKWSGIRVLKDELIKFTKNGKLRVITTSYMGATDLKAIEFLSKLNNTEIKISYDTKRTRLHAKAYIFHRKTGFSSSYVGSSNISNPAMTDGLEWNVKICQYESPHLWNKIIATFESYQNSKEFEIYSSDMQPKLKKALQSEYIINDENSTLLSLFDIKPYPYQEEILDKLRADRKLHNRHKNLVVAATGTGKTIIAAFDYKRQINSKNKPRLLFVAHREEILKQSQDTFRQVLKDQNFGEMWVGNKKAVYFDYLFISIQTFNSQKLWEAMPHNYYDYIIIDEFHRAAADSYQILLEHFKPKILLGLTATPERHDSKDIFKYFDNYISSEIRLPDAINRKLLCPFQYFGVTDRVDYTKISWRSGKYDINELNNIYTGDDHRIKLIIEKLYEILLNINKVRGLCFCVSQVHANYMAKKLNEVNIPAVSLIANSPREIREDVKRKLINYEINFICVVDLFNEGVDIPEIDTVLFLRPTESLTVFLQQLGRGLRFSEGKENLTVIDFIGQAHQKFNFEDRFRSLVGRNTHHVKEEIVKSFPNLPSGCVIKLEKVAQEYVLDNIKHSLSQITRVKFIGRIKEFENDSGKKPTLKNFLTFYKLELKDIYKRGLWSRLCADAGVIENFDDKDEIQLTKGIKKIIHNNCEQNLLFIKKFLNEGLSENNVMKLKVEEKILLKMFLYSIWNSKSPNETILDSFKELKNNPTMLTEIKNVIEIMKESTDSIVYKAELPFITPLHVHALYTRDEILVGLGFWNLKSKNVFQAGVLYIKDIKTDVFFITLNKTEKDYSPTTMYEDYAINEEFFHWQSQSTTGEESKTGQRYINHEKEGVNVLLFVREFKKKDGIASPYYFLGPAEYVKHEGSKPMSIVWKLKHKIPGKLIRKTSRLNTA